MIGSLLGQRMPPFDAAALGVYLHGLAGEIAGKRFGRRSALAREVVDAIAEAVRTLENDE
jgi:NAD(P)H-hydrate epimerase